PHRHQPAQEIQAVHARHLDVQRDHVRRAAADAVEGQQRIGRDAQQLHVRLRRHHPRQEGAHDGGIVDDQNPDHGGARKISTSPPGLAASFERYSRSRRCTVSLGSTPSRLTCTLPVASEKCTLRGDTPSRSCASTRMPSSCRKCSTNSEFLAPTSSRSKPASSWAPPNTLATIRRRSAPRRIMSLISTSIAYSPKPAEAAQGESGRALSPGSMKWFMPPMRSAGSHRQVETQEPSTVPMAPCPWAA